MTMKAYKILLTALAAVLAVSCYDDYGMPEPYVKYESEADFAAETGLRKLTIKEVKDKFEEASMWGSLSGTGTNQDWARTKSVKFGYLSSTEEGSDHVKEWPEAAGCYIAGKVLSDDKQGNIFKSLYIYDGTAAIEIKLTNGNYLKYKIGNWVFIKLDGLYLGNYRMMLSIGEGPTASINAMAEDRFYANSNMEDPARIREHVFVGPEDELVDGVDIKVVTKDNYTQLSKEDFGRLIRFEGLTCYYSGVENQNGVVNNVLRNGSYEQIYPSWIDTNTRNPVVSKPWYKWAFSEKNIFLYGSVCFTYLDLHNTSATHYTSDAGIYVVRSSGYSRFAGKPVLRDGATGDITAIYAIYSQQSTYRGGSSDYATYQLSLNTIDDMNFAESDYLTEAEAEALTPDGYDKDGNYDSANDSHFVPSENSDDRE